MSLKLTTRSLPIGLKSGVKYQGEKGILMQVRVKEYLKVCSVNPAQSP